MLDRLSNSVRPASKSLARRENILCGVYNQNRSLERAARPTREGRRASVKRLLPLMIALPVVLAAMLGLLPAAFSDEPVLRALMWGGGSTGDYVSDAADAAPQRPAAAPHAPLATGRIVTAARQLPRSEAAAHAGGGPAPEAVAPPPQETALAALSISPEPLQDDGKPVELADVAPLSSDDSNLKALFGLSVQTIVIDAGHGGRDPGASGASGTREKDITLDVALRLRDRLDALGNYRILLVRDEDVFVPLRERAAFANAQDADLFVSIHVNYLPNVATNAVETYYFGHYQDERTRMLAERENQGSDFSVSEFENLMRNMQDAIKLQESKALAYAIQGSLLQSIRARNQRVLDNGVRTAPFVVLLGVKAPSVLVEIGSLSSPDAEQNLRRDAYRDEMAAYLAAGINHYLNRQSPQEYRHEDEDKLAASQ